MSQPPVPPNAAAPAGDEPPAQQPAVVVEPPVAVQPPVAVTPPPGAEPSAPQPAPGAEPSAPQPAAAESPAVAEEPEQPSLGQRLQEAGLPALEEPPVAEQPPAAEQPPVAAQPEPVTQPPVAVAEEPAGDRAPLGQRLKEAGHHTAEQPQQVPLLPPYVRQETSQAQGGEQPSVWEPQPPPRIDDEFAFGYSSTPQPGWYPAPAGPPPPQFALVPRRKRSAGKILLFVLAALLLLCGGGATAVFVFLKDDAKELVTATETRVVAPAELMGRPQITEPEVQAMMDASVASVKQSLRGVTSTVAAVYGVPAKQDLMAVIAASKVTVDPDEALVDFIAGLETSGLRDIDLATVEPGPLGGAARCGNASAGMGTGEQVPMGICVWLDHGSFGLVTMYFKTGKDLQPHFVQIRGLVEQTG